MYFVIAGIQSNICAGRSKQRTITSNFGVGPAVEVCTKKIGNALFSL